MPGQGSVTSDRTVQRGRKRTVVEERHEPSEVVEEPVAAEPTAEALARVEFAVGATLNLGNYESARVDVKLTLPCPQDMESIDMTYAYAKEWAERKLNTEIAYYRKQSA